MYGTVRCQAARVYSHAAHRGTSISTRLISDICDWSRPRSYLHQASKSVPDTWVR